MLDALDQGTLRVGMHVIAFDNGESESLLTPEPGSMLLLALGSLAVFLGRRHLRPRRR